MYFILLLSLSSTVLCFHTLRSFNGIPVMGRRSYVYKEVQSKNLQTCEERTNFASSELCAVPRGIWTGSDTR